MKRHGGSKTYVMFALLAVLFVSLGYLSTQTVKEGMVGEKKKKIEEGMKKKTEGMKNKK